MQWGWKILETGAHRINQIELNTDRKMEEEDDDLEFSGQTDPSFHHMVRLSSTPPSIYKLKKAT